MADTNNPPLGNRSPRNPGGTGLAAIGIAQVVGAAVALTVGVWLVASFGGAWKRAAYVFAFIVLLGALIMNVDRLQAMLGQWRV